MPETLSEILATFDDPAKAHAAMVHLPIAIAFIAPAFLLVAGLLPGRRRMGSLIAMIAYAVLAIATLVTIQSGESAYDTIGDVTAEIGTMAHDHGEMAERVWTWGAIGTALAAVGLFKEKKKLAIGGVWTALAFGLFTAGWTAVAAHRGGVLVYEHAVGIPEPIPEADPDADPRLTFFLQEVRPVLAENCMGCHRDGRPAAGLDLSTIRTILEGAEHGPVIKPGYPDASMLITVVRGQHPEIARMPPGKNNQLSEQQIESIRVWIEQGAVWANGSSSDATPAD